MPEKPPNLKDIIEEFQSKQPKESDNDGEIVERQIEQSVSSDRTRNCISTSNKHKKIQVRIHSTDKVIRACLLIFFILRWKYKDE